MSACFVDGDDDGHDSGGGVGAFSEFTYIVAQYTILETLGRSDGVIGRCIT